MRSAPAISAPNAVTTTTQRHRGESRCPSGKTSGMPTSTTIRDGMNTKILAMRPASTASGCSTSAPVTPVLAMTHEPPPMSRAKPIVANSSIGPMGLPGTRTVRNAPTPPNAIGMVTNVTTSIGVAAHVVRLSIEASRAIPCLIDQATTARPDKERRRAAGAGDHERHTRRPAVRTSLRQTSTVEPDPLPGEPLRDGVPREQDQHLERRRPARTAATPAHGPWLVPVSVATSNTPCGPTTISDSANALSGNAANSSA